MVLVRQQPQAARAFGTVPSGNFFAIAAASRTGAMSASSVKYRNVLSQCIAEAHSTSPSPASLRRPLELKVQYRVWCIKCLTLSPQSTSIASAFSKERRRRMNRTPPVVSCSYSQLPSVDISIHQACPWWEHFTESGVWIPGMK